MASPLPEPDLPADFRTRSPVPDSFPVVGLDTVQDDSNIFELPPLYSDEMKGSATCLGGIKTQMNKELLGPLYSGSLSSKTSRLGHSFSLFFPLLLITLGDDLFQGLDTVAHSLVYAELPQVQSHSVVVCDVRLAQAGS